MLPHIVWETPITEAAKFYTDANKSEKAVYKSENLSNVNQNYRQLKFRIMCYSHGS